MEHITIQEPFFKLCFCKASPLLHGHIYNLARQAVTDPIESKEVGWEMVATMVANKWITHHDASRLNTTIAATKELPLTIVQE